MFFRFYYVSSFYLESERSRFAFACILIMSTFSATERQTHTVQGEDTALGEKHLYWLSASFWHTPSLPDPRKGFTSRCVHSEENRIMLICRCLQLVWLTIVLGGFAFRTFAADPVTSITILALSGKAEVSRRVGIWDPAYTNQVLVAGDKMRTGVKSRATLRLSDGTTMAVGAEASFEVPQEKKGVTLNPLKGLFYFFHRDNPGDFELRSRTAAAAVRGTEFHLEVDGDNAWLLSVLDGNVLVQTERGELDLKTGQAASIKPGQKPEPVVMREANDLIQWCLYYPAVLNIGDLILSPDQQTAWGPSLAAYRQGNIAVARERFDFEPSVASEMEAIYRAQLLLSIGDVPEAEHLLASIVPNGENAVRKESLKVALLELIAVVKARPCGQMNKPETASAWLAKSYCCQSQGDLPGSRAAILEALQLAPDFGLAWERLAEIEFSFGRVDKARAAAAKSLRFAPRSARLLSLLGFLAASNGRLAEAKEKFDEAIAIDGNLGNAWLGRGLCRIRVGELAAGRQDLLIAASVEPQRSIFRSYLGKAFVLSWNRERAHQEFELAQRLDPHDPTSWLYSALLLLEENRINEAIADLERSSALNDNRALFRSRLLLDQDRAVRGANLAAVYQDAGMHEVAVRESTKAVESDYSNYSAHQFLANSYNGLRDPRQVNLRYETSWLSEYMMANLLAPVGAGTLSPMVSQQEYSRLFQQNGMGFISATEYFSRGDWLQSAVQYGQFSHADYALEASYWSFNGDRPNNDFEQLTLSLRFKQEITPHDSLYVQVVEYSSEGGDLAQYYDPLFSNRSLRVKEKQEPLLIAGFHHEWVPGIHTLALAGRLQDTVELTNAAAGTLFFRARNGVKQFASYALYNQAYKSEHEIYFTEAQQLFELGRHTLIFGGRYQAGEFESRSDIQNGVTFPGGTPTGINPISQSVSTHFQRSGLYAYEQWRPLDSLLLIGGVAADWISYPNNYLFAPLSASTANRHLVGPKAGLVWTPAVDTTLRGGYSRALGGVSFDQSFRLEPTQVAGFNQAFRSLVPESVGGSTAAPEFEIFGLQLEQRVHTRTYLGLSAELLRSEGRRSIGAVQFDPIPLLPTPDPFQPVSTRQTLEYEEQVLTATAHQLLGRDFTVGLSYKLSLANLVSKYPDIPSNVVLSNPLVLEQEQEATLHQVRLYGIFNHPSGFFCSAEGLWNGQDNSKGSATLADNYFWQFNLYAGYRWWQRRAEFHVGLLNLTDQDYRLNPLSLTAQLPRDRTLTMGFRFSF